MLKLHSCATNYIIIHINCESYYYYYYSESAQFSNIKQTWCKKKEHGVRARGWNGESDSLTYYYSESA